MVVRRSRTEDDRVDEKGRKGKENSKHSKRAAGMLRMRDSKQGVNSYTRTTPSVKLVTAPIARTDCKNTTINLKYTSSGEISHRRQRILLE